VLTYATLESGKRQQHTQAAGNKGNRLPESSPTGDLREELGQPACACF